LLRKKTVANYRPFVHSSITHFRSFPFIHNIYSAVVSWNDVNGNHGPCLPHLVRATKQSKALGEKSIERVYKKRQPTADGTQSSAKDRIREAHKLTIQVNFPVLWTCMCRGVCDSIRY
jgi:hypothetical protein